MKTSYIKLLIALLFLAISTSNFAQTIPSRSGEFRPAAKPGVTIGFPIIIRDEVPDITFSGSRNSALDAHRLIIEAQRRQYDAWLKRQNEGFKKEIEKQLGQPFSDFKNAQKEFYKDKELRNVKGAAKPLTTKYKAKTNLKKEIRSRCINNIKLLNLRANEINAGNINNSRYGHLKYGSTPIGNLRSISQINTLRTQEINEFKDNQWRLEHELEALNFIKSLAALNSRTAPILNHPYHNQLKHYNTFNVWEQLDLMQASIHNTYYLKSPNAPFGNDVNFGQQGYVEGFALNQFPAHKRYLFHPNFWQTLVRYPTGPVPAKKLHNQRMNEAINKAINQVPNPEFLTDVAIAGLGARNENFIKKDPDLNKEVRDYFKKNDFSKVSSDCVNYLLNQYHNGSDFTPNANLYKSATTPLYQNGQNPNRALNWKPNAQAVREGFTNFGNVLSELLKDNVNPRFEGRIIRDMFGINDLNVNAFILNEWLGSGFYFKTNNGASVEIQYEGNNGSVLYNNGVSTSNYLNNLVQSLNTRLNSSLTNAQKEWLFLNPRSVFEFNNYLNGPGNGSFKKELIKFEIDTELSKCNYNLGNNDCIEAIRKMAIGLRALHGEEGGLMASYFESVISDLSEFTRADVEAFYGTARAITLDYNRRMRTAIFGAFIEGITPIVEIALFEVGGSVAIKLLRKIPLSWVSKGARLNNMVKKITQLGVPGIQSNVRVVKTSNPISKAKELFISLTRNAESVTQVSANVTKANMGNGNFIIYRTISGSGFPATIEFNFAQLLGTNSFKIKFGI